MSKYKIISSKKSTFILLFNKQGTIRSTNQKLFLKINFFFYTKKKCYYVETNEEKIKKWNVWNKNYMFCMCMMCLGVWKNMKWKLLNVLLYVEVWFVSLWALKYFYLNCVKSEYKIKHIFFTNIFSYWNDTEQLRFQF